MNITKQNGEQFIVIRSCGNHYPVQYGIKGSYHPKLRTTTQKELLSQIRQAQKETGIDIQKEINDLVSELI